LSWNRLRIEKNHFWLQQNGTSARFDPVESGRVQSTSVKSGFGWIGSMGWWVGLGQIQVVYPWLTIQTML